MKRLIEKFMETGSVGDAKHTGRLKTRQCQMSILKQCVRVLVKTQKH